MVDFIESKDQVECIVKDCPLYVHRDWSAFLLAITPFPLYLTAGLFTLSLYQQEIYVLLVSFVLTSNYVLNWALQLILNDPPRFPNCYMKFGAPSFASQHLVLIDVIVLTFPFFFWRPIQFKALVVARFLVCFTMFAWIYIGANTPWELLVGAIVGLFYGLLFQFLMRFVVASNIQWILSWRVCKLLSLMDSMMTTTSKKNIIK